MNQTREEKVAATRARMAELAAKFIERSVRELATMRDGLAKLHAGQDDVKNGDAGKADALHDLRHLAHRMCGTGATLGFETLADHAARIEKLTESGPAGGSPDAAALTQIGAGIDALGEELARLDAATKRPPGT